MSEEFNPYEAWLKIPLSQQPPSHYRLLGLPDFESDAAKIEAAADRQMAHVRTFQAGPRGKHTQPLLNELARARRCLLNPRQREAYDQQLRNARQPQPSARQPLRQGMSAPTSANQPALSSQPSAQADRVAGTPKPQSPGVDAEPELIPLPDDFAAGSAAVAAQATAAELEEVIEMQPLSRAGLRPVAPLPKLEKQGASTPQSLQTNDLPGKWLWPLIGGGGILAGIVLVVAIGLTLRGEHTPPQPRLPKVERPQRLPAPVASKPADAKRLPGQANQPATSPPQPKPSPVSSNKADRPADTLRSLSVLRDLSPRQLEIVKGRFSLTNGTLMLHGSSPDLVQIRVRPPRQFDLSITVRRLSNQEALLIGFPFDDDLTAIVIDGFADRGGRTGLSMVKGMRPGHANYPDPGRRRFLPLGQSVRLQLEVRATRVTLKANDRVAYQWTGDPGDVALNDFFRPRNHDRLFLASWESAFEISELTLSQVQPDDPFQVLP